MQLYAPHHRFINAQCNITRGSSITYLNGAAEQVKKKRLADHGTVQHPAPSIVMLHRGCLPMYREMGGLDCAVVFDSPRAPPSTQQASNSQRSESTVRASRCCYILGGVGPNGSACTLSIVDWNVKIFVFHVERRKVARQWKTLRSCGQRGRIGPGMRR